MRPFVCGWVSEWVRESVALCLVDTIQTTVFAGSLSYFTYKLFMMRGGTLLIFGHGVKGQCKVKFGTLSIKPCGQDTDYSFCPITFILHI